MTAVDLHAYRSWPCVRSRTTSSACGWVHQVMQKWRRWRIWTFLSTWQIRQTLLCPSSAVRSLRSRNGYLVAAVLLEWFQEVCARSSEGEKHCILGLVRRKGGQTEARGGGVLQVGCPTLVIWLTAVGLCLRGNKGGVSYPCARGVLRSLVCSLQRSPGCVYEQVLYPQFPLPLISSPQSSFPLSLYTHIAYT
jgi:hypothetical protein